MLRSFSPALRPDRSCTICEVPADPSFSFQDLVEVRAIDAVALGESHLRSGALNCGPEQLTDFTVVEYARWEPQIARDREQILRTQPELGLSCGHAATPPRMGNRASQCSAPYACGVWW